MAEVFLAAHRVKHNHARTIYISSRLKTELEHQFKDYRISRKYYPFGIPAGNLSLFSIWQIKSDLPYSLCDVV